MDRVRFRPQPDGGHRSDGWSPDRDRHRIRYRTVRDPLNTGPAKSGHCRNDAPIGEIKVVADNGWLAAPPSGTEDIYKVYAESFCGEEHLRAILREVQAIVDTALGTNKR